MNKPKKTLKARCLIFIILSAIPLLLKSQNIQLVPDSLGYESQKTDYEIIKDINGEICNLVIVKTEKDSIKFHTNRGVERIKHEKNKYKIWIPKGANIFKIIIPGYPLYEERLTFKSRDFNVFIYKLDIGNNENTFITDSLKKTLSINTIPSNAGLYLNDHYLGRTPVTLPVNSKDNITASFKISKFGYLTEQFIDTIVPDNNIIEVELKRLTDLKNSLIAFQLGYHDHGNPQPNIGITYGRTGKTGFLISLKVEYSGNPEDKWGHTNKLSRAKLSANILKPLFTPLYGYAGIGVSKKSYGEMLIDEVYEEDNTFFNTNLGLMPRILKNLLLMIELSTGYSFNDGIEISSNEYSLGLAYAF